MGTQWDEELAALRAAHDIQKYLQAKAIQNPRARLDPQTTFEELTTTFDNHTLEVVGWGDLFMLDMMYAKQGGNYKLHDYGRPQAGTIVTISNRPCVVTCTGIFTFAAEPMDDGDESTEEEVYALNATDV
jgi:hypothetical protein